MIEDTVNLSGITFRFIDTAGIRDTHDTIENMGIARSFHKMEQAEIVLWVVDNTCAEAQIRQLSPRILPLCSNKQLIILLNKSDQVSAVPTKLSGLPENTVTLSISAKEKTGIQELQNLLVKTASVPELQTHLSGDFISQDLRECLFHLAEIVGGEITADEVLGNIFMKFCIGK